MVQLSSHSGSPLWMVLKDTTDTSCTFGRSAKGRNPRCWSAGGQSSCGDPMQRYARLHVCREVAAICNKLTTVAPETTNVNLLNHPLLKKKSRPKAAFIWT